MLFNQINYDFTAFRKLAGGLLDIIFPPFCTLCENKLRVQERIVCDLCWNLLEPTNLGNWNKKITYNDGIDSALTGWYFDESFRSVIHSLKYQESRIIGMEFGKRLAHMFGEEIDRQKIDVILPVPLHSAKLRARSFNQSDLIANALAVELNIDYYPNLLKRKRNTTSQTTLQLKERNENVSGAFELKHSNEYRKFLIVDDVLTTGATLSACAQVLKKNGAEYISVVSAGTSKMDNI